METTTSSITTACPPPHLHSCHPCGISRRLSVAAHMHITFDSCSLKLQPICTYKCRSALACSKNARSTARAGAACDIYKGKAVVSVRACMQHTCSLNSGRRSTPLRAAIRHLRRHCGGRNGAERLGVRGFSAEAVPCFGDDSGFSDKGQCRK